MAEANYFRDHLTRTGPRALIKMEHYLDIYADLLAPWRGRDVSFLEIGVYKGGSIGMWKGYFGVGSRLAFADIDPAAKGFAEPGIAVEIGDQADPAFLSRLAAAHGPFDIVVDDGGHKMHQQIGSFRSLWPHLNDGGLYIVEDIHTSYWPGFGGGFRVQGSFIEFAKDLVDRMHSWYTEDDAGFPLHPMARELHEVRFFDSLAVFSKRRKEPPVSLFAEGGKVAASRRILEIRGRKSVF
jgi:hypothetical protein